MDKREAEENTSNTTSSKTNKSKDQHVPELKVDEEEAEQEIPELKIEESKEESESELTKKQIVNHYRKAESAIKQWGEDDGYVRAGSNGPGQGWYVYPNGYDGDVRRPRVLARDYDKLLNGAAKGVRSIYATINFLDPKKRFVQKKKSTEVWKKEEENDNPVQGNPLPEYSDIEFMTLFSDVDLKSEIKPRREEEGIKRTVGKSIEIYVGEFEKLAPNSVNVLDSGGGFYPFIHHDVTKPIGEEFDGGKRGRIFDELTDRFNEKLEEIWETVQEEVPEASSVLDPDMLNNKNRLMKVPLSIHKELDEILDSGTKSP
ncbi:hypothetical protein AKJ36_02405 [candidate division MSBL1 archaeon SCGC-AAA259I07]|uniref:Uncharacterized protein n=1 Tax=candidate division MSBL1 archaeon SCGC-AAA259I07 TaxID=1698266 RepID=A0A133UKG0_9EURY|nr:hypothetical protein AKJ36_02405 [candidate division MSBL1 archaeon SCGC-AAA259I07]